MPWTEVAVVAVAWVVLNVVFVVALARRSAR
jgi:hypothetical protein